MCYINSAILKVRGTFLKEVLSKILCYFKTIGLGESVHVVSGTLYPTAVGVGLGAPWLSGAGTRQNMPVGRPMYIYCDSEAGAR